VIPLLALAACAGGESADTGAPPFVETLDPDALHILASGTQAPNDPGHALTELSVALDVTWSIDLDPGEGTAGAVRYPEGDTVYVRSGLPPDFVSALDRVDATGALVWSQDAFFSGDFSFAHGVVRTPDGDFVIPDPVVSRVLCASEAGDLLWEMSFRGDDGLRAPNGIDLRTDADGVTRIVVSELVAPDSDTSERVEVYRLGERDQPPTLEWRFEAGTGAAQRLWPHGPRFLDDGSVLINYAALGQVAHLVDGEEDWRAPDEPGPLAFPRDTLVLPDGTWLVADAAEEVLRVYDPRGRFEVVDAVRVPGVFGLAPVTCGPAGSLLPCL
jgi:hypothetical protein